MIPPQPRPRYRECLTRSLHTTIIPYGSSWSSSVWRHGEHTSSDHQGNQKLTSRALYNSSGPISTPSQPPWCRIRRLFRGPDWCSEGSERGSQRLPPFAVPGPVGSRRPWRVPARLMRKGARLEITGLESDALTSQYALQSSRVCPMEGHFVESSGGSTGSTSSPPHNIPLSPTLETGPGVKPLPHLPHLPPQQPHHPDEPQPIRWTT